MFTHFYKWPLAAVNGLFMALQKRFTPFFPRGPREMHPCRIPARRAALPGTASPGGALLFLLLLLTALPGRAQCPPLSTLPCDQVTASLPFALQFTGAEGGLADGTGTGTGFRMVDRPSAPLVTPTFADVPGYEPSRLALNPAGSGTLAITTTAGIAYRTNGANTTTQTTLTNSQVNALGVGVAAATHDLILQTTLLQPPAGTNNSEQAGLWFGLDEDNFLKLVVVSAGGGNSQFELRREINGLSVATGLPDQIRTTALLNLTAATVKLKLVVKRGAAAGADGTAQGFYTLNNGTEVSLGTLALPAAYFAGKTYGSLTASFAGIFASHRRAATPLTYTFDAFSVEAVAPALAFSPESMYFNVTEGQNVGTRNFTVNVPAGAAAPSAVTLTSDVSWLTVPAPLAAGATGVLQFNTAALLAGSYTATVTAAAPGYVTTTLPVSVTVSPVGQVAEAIKVNFSDAATVPPAGFLRDSGKPFGLRTTTDQGTPAGSTPYTYGWKRRTDNALLDLSLNGRNRNATLDPDIDVRLATLMHMQGHHVTGGFNGTPVEGYWEMQVPNGTYDVTVSAGDALPSSSIANNEFHTLNVEGVNAINRFQSVGANGTSTRFASGTVRVAVVDGALTINASETIGGVAYNGFNTKINSVVIQPVSTSPLLLFSPAQYTVNVPSGQVRPFKVNLNNSDEDPVTVQLTATQDNETGTPEWLTFNGQILSPANSVTYVVGATGNEVSFSVDATQLMARTEPYVARITAASPGYESSTLVLSVKVSDFNEGFRPYVTVVRPADGATNVSPSQSVSVELEFPSGNSIDGTTATPDKVLLYKVEGDELTPVTGTSVNSTAAGDAITLSAALELNTTYQFVITDQVKDANGYAMIPFTSRFTTLANVQDNPTDLTGVSFREQILIDQAFGTDGFTTLVIGPDRRLYAATSGGKIERWDLKADGTLENHVTISPFGASRRLLIGFVFDQAATAGNLVAWITHSSPAFEGATEWSGKLSRINLSNPAAPQVTDYIINLPRSYKDHSSNSLAYGPDGALYFPQGSNAAMGAPDNSWGNRPERLLTASVLRFDIAKAVQQGLPLNAKTEEGGTYNPYAANAPLTLYATGLRNAYDLVWHSNGELYVPTNGSAAGGNTPALPNGAIWSDGSVYTGPTVPALLNVRDTQNDYLFRVLKGKYYGSPNPLRNEYILNGGNPTEGIDPGEVVWTDNLGVVRGYPVGTPLEPNYGGYAYDFELNKSPNGAIEYKSEAFGGKLKGKLLVCRFSGGDDLIVLEPGTVNKDIIRATEGDKVPGFRRPFANPLDVVEDPLTGNLYVSEYFDGNGDGKPRITLLIAAVPPVLAARIEVPAQLVVSDPVAEDNLSGTAAALETVTVRNTGTSPLIISSLALTGADAAQFSLPAGMGGLTLAPGASHNVQIAFAAGSAGLKTASLFITSNHQGADGHVTQVALRGLGTAGFDGADEPSLQRVLDAHGLAVNAGDDDPATNVIHSSTIQQKAALLGDEISVQSFVKAGSGPVTLQPLSVFGPTTTDPIVRFGWYASTQAATAQPVFTVTNKNEAGAVEKRKGQTVNVQYTGTPVFDPANARFGFYSEWPFFSGRRLYSEDDLNTFAGAVPHHVRVYAVPGEANAYIIAFEEHVSGFDYQDVVVIARNVKPYVPGTIAFAPAQLNFTVQQGNPEPPAAQTATATVSGGAPNLTLTSTANWLSLPVAGTPGAALSFGINVANLPATAGTYYATVTASANGYTAGTMQVALTVTPPAMTPLISVNKDELILSGVKTGAYSSNITLKNEGTAPLSLGSLTLTGPHANLFSYQFVDEGQPVGGDIEPGQSRIVRVTFTPAGAIGPFNATLNLVTNAANSPTLALGLYGLSTNGLEGLNEPPLAWVVQTLGYQVNVGWTGLTPATDPIGAQPKGEEVLVPLFEKAGDGNVTITPVARYSPNQVLPFGFYTKSGSTPVRTAVGALSGVLGQHQTLFPSVASGSDQFDPGSTVFGLYVLGLQNRLTYTEDALNAGGPALHAVRIYPMKNRQGQPAETSFLVCFEDAANGDYQDYMFVLSNVIPAGTRKTLAFSPQNLYFNVPEGGSAPAKTVTLTASNGTPAGLTLSKSGNSNWLVLPASPAMGSLSFGINVAGLVPGVYTTTVTASATGYTPATAEVTLVVTGLSANAVKINFQPTATVDVPAGYGEDNGAAYTDARGYGWINPATKLPKDHTAFTRERAGTGELRLRTLIIMQPSAQTPGAWEYKVPAPGLYNVTVSAGDQNFGDSNHRINVEGTTAISNFVPVLPGANVPPASVEVYRSATVTVEVTDGKLTIDAVGGINTKINYVIIDPATPDGDLIPPVASINLQGTVLSAGSYRDQVLATITATDAGGAGLKTTQYSVNGAPYTDYTGPILFSTAGNYALRARAVDGNNNETETAPVTFAVVVPQPSNAKLFVENLDRFPASDQLTFSLIREPWRRTEPTITPYNANHDTVTVRLHNKGFGALELTGLTFSRPNSYRIVQLSTPTVTTPVVPGAPLPLPYTVAPGKYVDVMVQFVNDPALTVSRVRVLHDKLTVASNDDQVPTRDIALHALLQNKGEGSSEPFIGEIIDAFGFKSRAGFTSSDNTDGESYRTATTEEIITSFFVRADPARPVTVWQMGAYHGCCASTESIRWYNKGSGTMPLIFTHIGLDGQSLLPRRGLPNVAGTGTFPANFNTSAPPPNTPFGLVVSSSNSDRTKNSEGKIGLRFYKVIDANGNLVPNAYIVGHDYIGNPLVTNYDYQDNVYFISNVRPETGSPNFSPLAAAPSAANFGSAVVQTTNTLTVDLVNAGLVYPAPPNDPDIQITSVSIVGPNLNEFAVTMPAVTRLAPQATSPITVQFKPLTRGIKNAALLVQYAGGPSPLRIPLYGVADDNCSSIVAVKRIKSGADAAVTIGGNVWEADAPFRAGQLNALIDRPLPAPVVAGTDDDVLYQTYLSSKADLNEIRYEIPMPNGDYMVRLHLVENFWREPIKRVFSVKIENVTRLANLDIWQEVGYRAALVKDFNVALADGKLNFTFNPTVNRLAIAGIEIFGATAPANALAFDPAATLTTGATCGLTDGTITLAVKNTTATSMLYKLGPGGVYQSSPTFANLAAGTYTFYARENKAGGCETSGVFVISTANSTLDFTVTAAPIGCDALSTTATVSGITGGSSAAGYSAGWSNGQTGLTATGLAPGTYSVTVTDGTGCGRTKEVTIARPASCVTTAIRINAGGATQTVNGTTWSGCQTGACNGYVTGGYAHTQSPMPVVTGVAANMNQALYQTRWSGGEVGANPVAVGAVAFKYNIPVTNGNYLVRLYFVEITQTGAGQRTFDVNIEGVKRLDKFDIFVAAGGVNKAVVQELPTSVADGNLTIDFIRQVFNASINAIEIIPVTGGPNQLPVANAGADQTLTLPLSTATVTGSGNDTDGAIAAYQWTAVSTPVPATLATPNAATTQISGLTAAGTYTFRLTVTDNAGGTATDDVTLTVNKGNQVISFPAIADKVTTSAPFNAGASTNAPGLSVTYSLVSGPATVTATGQITLTGTPGTVVVRASQAGDANYNPATDVERSFNVVESTNTAPVLAPIASQSVTAGQTVSFTASATDADQPVQTLTYSLGNAPQGTAIDPATGAFSWLTAATGTFTFSVRVTDNGLPALSDEEQVSVTVNANQPVLSTLRINAGGTAQTVNGTTWSGCQTGACNGYVTGGYQFSLSPMPVVTGVPANMNQALYQTRWTGGQWGTGPVAIGAVAFKYTIPVTNGNYTVRLHFAELNKSAAGQRVFDVSIEGVKRLDRFDVFAAAGGANKAIVREFVTAVSDGNLTIDFIRQVDNAFVNAIEIIPVTQARMNTAGTTGKDRLEVNVFPNPTGGRFRVALAGVDAAKATTRLTDATGNVWLRNKHEVVGEQTLELDITHLQSGVYLLEVQEGSRRRTVRVMKY
jgi:hypothetical protein